MEDIVLVQVLRIDDKSGAWETEARVSLSKVYTYILLIKRLCTVVDNI